MPEELDLSALVDDGDGNEATVGEMLDRGRNRTSWQRKLKTDEMAIAEDRKSLTATINRVVDKVVETPTPTLTEEVVQMEDFDLEEEMKNLPDAVEDPAGHSAALTDVMRRQGQSITESATVRAAQEADVKVRQSEGKQMAKDSQTAAKDNVERLRTWAKDQSLPTSGDTFDKMVEAVGSLRGAQWADPLKFGTTTVWSYREEAFEAGIKLVPELDAARVDGIVNERSVEIGEEGGTYVPPLPKPSENSSRGDKIKYLRSLSEDQVVAAVGEMSAEERGEMGFAAYADSAEYHR